MEDCNDVYGTTWRTRWRTTWETRWGTTWRTTWGATRRARHAETCETRQSGQTRARVLEHYYIIIIHSYPWHSISSHSTFHVLHAIYHYRFYMCLCVVLLCYSPCVHKQVPGYTVDTCFSACKWCLLSPLRHQHICSDLIKCKKIFRQGSTTSRYKLCFMWTVVTSVAHSNYIRDKVVLSTSPM